jgi:outer membrane protein OmpA-like peptidoglycan-associated protein
MTSVEGLSVDPAPSPRERGRTVSRLGILVALVLLVPGLVGPALAQAAYSAEDVIKHFAPAGLGKQKSVCFGTDDECKDAAAPARAPAAATPMDLVVTFDKDSDVLRPEAKRNLLEFAKALRSPQLAAMKFEVGGHTDASGNDDYNQALSERRAASVVRFLSEQGVPTDRLIARGFGRSAPRAADPMDPANRRVETRPVG